ncbi:unnamed protein product [Schistocephalus solidus]|uniref:C2H2-type domain-containing protein n=1 Tax=Schistocephalus solidus TaxID=70667 RepID=A0A183T662_SCHSO|nr:unnamed protein product [Schistocephalus solidus]
MVGHLRIHRTETDEPVPGVPTRDKGHCLHCPRAFTHRMGLFSHMCIHDSGIHHNVASTAAPRTPCAPDTPITTTTDNNHPAPPGFSCPNCARNFPSRISLVGHLRILLVLVLFTAAIRPSLAGLDYVTDFAPPRMTIHGSKPGQFISFSSPTTDTEYRRSKNNSHVLMNCV